METLIPRQNCLVRINITFLPFLNLKPLNKLLNYIYIFILIFKVRLKQIVSSIFDYYFK